MLSPRLKTGIMFGVLAAALVLAIFLANALITVNREYSNTIERLALNNLALLLGAYPGQSGPFDDLQGSMSDKQRVYANKIVSGNILFVNFSNTDALSTDLAKLGVICKLRDLTRSGESLGLPSTFVDFLSSEPIREKCRKYDRFNNEFKDTHAISGRQQRPLVEN